MKWSLTTSPYRPEIETINSWFGLCVDVGTMVDQELDQLSSVCTVRVSRLRKGMMQRRLQGFIAPAIGVSAVLKEKFHAFNLVHVG